MDGFNLVLYLVSFLLFAAVGVFIVKLVDHMRDYMRLTQDTLIKGERVVIWGAAQCAPRKKLIIELDGSQHLEQQEYDDERSKYLEARGYRVLRFWNNDVVNDVETVLNVIWSALNE